MGAKLNDRTLRELAPAKIDAGQADWYADRSGVGEKLSELGNKALRKLARRGCCGRVQGGSLDFFWCQSVREIAAGREPETEIRLRTKARLWPQVSRHYRLAILFRMNNLRRSTQHLLRSEISE